MASARLLHNAFGAAQPCCSGNLPESNRIQCRSALLVGRESSGGSSARVVTRRGAWGAMKMTRRGVDLVVVGTQKANPEGTTGSIAAGDVAFDDSADQLLPEEAEDRQNIQDTLQASRLGWRDATELTKASCLCISSLKVSRFLGLGRSRGYRLVSGGTRRNRAMVTRAEYDGKSLSSLTEREERYTENGVSTSKLDDLVDSSQLRESQSQQAARKLGNIEERIERTIFDFRFLTLFGVVGSLLGAVLCFLKGCLFVAHSYREYIRACFGGGVHSSRVILYLVEAVDVYLMGTVMLIFGMGLYELFVSSLEVPGGMCRGNVNDGSHSTVCGSNLFGLFRLRQRPKWLEIRSLDELKTKLGHVIVMILLVGMFEKSKKVIVHTSMDFLCFSASILLSSGALYLLSILHHSQINNLSRGEDVRHA